MKRPLTGRSIYDLNRDYIRAQERAEESDLDEPRVKSLRTYRRFIERQSHRLGSHPGQLWSLAHAQPLDCPVRAEALALEQAGKRVGRPWFRLLNPSPTDPEPALIRVLLGHSSTVGCVAFAPDGRCALSGSDDNTLRLWDVQTGQELRVFKGHSNYVTSVAFAPDGRCAVSGSNDKTLRLWDVQNGQQLHVFHGLFCSVNSVTFSPDGRCALSGSHDETLRLWDVQTGEELHVFQGHSDWVRSVTFAPDGRSALSGSQDRTVRVWDVRTGVQVALFSSDYPVCAVAWHPCDNRVVCVGDEGGHVLFFCIEELVG